MSCVKASLSSRISRRGDKPAPLGDWPPTPPHLLFSHPVISAPGVLFMCRRNVGVKYGRHESPCPLGRWFTLRRRRDPCVPVFSLRAGQEPLKGSFVWPPSPVGRALMWNEEWVWARVEPQQQRVWRCRHGWPERGRRRGDTFFVRALWMQMRLRVCNVKQGDNCSETDLVSMTHFPLLFVCSCVCVCVLTGWAAVREVRACPTASCAVCDPGVFNEGMYFNAGKG